MNPVSSLRDRHKILATCLLVFAAAIARADTIDFENQCPKGQQATGPCSALFSTVGNAQTLSIATSIGSVTIKGGALFDNIAHLPADETVVYGTAGNAKNIGVSTGSGFTNPLTIIFPKPIDGFSVDVLNGNTVNVDYEVADNAGNTASLELAPNFSSGLASIGFAATGTTVTISALTGQSTKSGMTWDFLIDNIVFDTRSSTPEPTSLLLVGLGFVALGLAWRSSARRKTTLVTGAGLLLLISTLCVPSASAQTPLTLSCPDGNGTVKVPYTSALTATGGVPPYTFSISSGALPGGLTLNSTSGALTGTPLQPGTSSFTAQVVDSLIPGAGGSPDTATATCSIAIAPTLAINNLSPDATVAGGPTFTLTINGSGFLPGSIAVWNGTPLTTTFVSTSQLTAQIPSALITTPQSATVTVSFSELTSNSVTFTVGTPINDPSAMSLVIINPNESDVVEDWQTGFALADFEELAQDGYTDGYIQLVLFDPDDPEDPGTWVVQNLPISGPQFLPGTSAMFQFRQRMNPPPGTNNVPPVLALQVYTQRAIQAIQAKGLRALLTTPQQAPWYGQGFMPGGTPPTLPNGAVPTAITGQGKQEALTDADSVKQQTNECGPASVANSMQYLFFKRLELKDPPDGADNTPSNGAGATKNSRVARLDKNMDYNAKNGVSSLNLKKGKESYISGGNPAGKKLDITTHYQGWFCPGPKQVPDCKGGEKGDADATPTVDFITEALKAKKDVEVCLLWRFSPVGGGHCVFVTGYEYVDKGSLTLKVTHDFFQGITTPTIDGRKATEQQIKELGHPTLTLSQVQVDGKSQLWLSLPPGTQTALGPTPGYFPIALITNVITEEPNKP
jgi:hypothetical protein